MVVRRANEEEEDGRYVGYLYIRTWSIVCLCLSEGGSEKDDRSCLTKS